MKGTPITLYYGNRLLIFCATPALSRSVPRTLPRGLLRESIGNIRRANFIFITKSTGKDTDALKARLRALNPTAEISECAHRPKYLQNVYTGERQSLDSLNGQAVALISGIASPEGFESEIIRRGGVYLGRNQLVIVWNCTVVSNRATSPGPGRGGGIGSSAGSNHVENTIIWGNSVISGTDRNWYVGAGSLPTFTNCCTAPHSATYMTNTVSSDPQFVDVPGGNYRLTRGSPCVGSGTIPSWMLGARDLDGHRRISIDGRVDMGAYEFVLSGTVFFAR